LALIIDGLLLKALQQSLSAIGTNRTSSDVRYSVAIGGRPDMAQTAHSVENDPKLNR
jgi:hypothetical protein